MKKNIYFFALLLTVPILLTACTKKEEISQESTQGESEKTVAQEDETYNGDIFDLIKTGKNLKCTFAFKNDEISTEGVTYVAGEKTRSEMNVKTSEGEEITTISLTDGKKMYTWNTGNNQGTEIDLTEFQGEEDMDTPEVNDEYKYDDQSKKMEYKCSPWINIDNSKFEVPSDIEFTNFSEMMKEMMEMGDQIDIGQ